MNADLSGGLDPAMEWLLAERPVDPMMRDSATLWIIDDSGALAFPRVTLDAIASDWERPWLQLNGVLADGRTVRVWEQAEAPPRIGKQGKPSVLGAGPLRFECLEPFRRWLMTFDGAAELSTTAAQMQGLRGGSPVNLQFRFEADMATAPWLMGSMSADAARKMRSGDAGALMGGVRYEQLCRVSGTARVGTQEYRVRGTGMRVRRQGVRRMGAATGHCQHSALFPSGRAFGANAFAPGPDGSQSFNEGFVMTEDGRKHPATLREAPWMTRLIAGNEPIPLVLESDLGMVRIEGETLLTTVDHHLFEMADTSILQQGVARYVWDGEAALGLFERCTLRDRMSGINGNQGERR